MGLLFFLYGRNPIYGILRDEKIDYLYCSFNIIFNSNLFLIEI